MIRFGEGKKRWSVAYAGRYPRGSFVVLFALGFIALFLTLPFPPDGLILLTGAIFLATVVGLGLIFLMLDGLPVPVTKLRGRIWTRHSTALQASLVGVILGTAMLVLAGALSLLFLPSLEGRFIVDTGLPVWQRILTAIDSAVLEELIFRLFLLSMLAWFLSRWWKSADVACGQGPLWAANVLVALGFGMAHLPQWSTITALTPTVVGAVVILNAIGGMTFGYLYFARGLGAAMVAHFVADTVLHVIGPNVLTA